MAILPKIQVVIFENARRACIGYSETKTRLQSSSEYQEFSSAKKDLKAAVRKCLVDESSLTQMMEEINDKSEAPLKKETKDKIMAIECRKGDV